MADLTMNLTSASRRSAAAGWHGDSMPLALACASIVLIGACGAEGTRSSGATITRLDGTTIDTTALTQRIEALTRAANVHGLTVTIFNGAEQVYARAFGVANLPAGKPLRTDTELYGASLSKAVFSVLVMKLVEQGVLDLDKPLQEYVSEPLWQNRGTSWHEDLSDLRSDPRYRRITARMSMSHTTGLPGWRWFEPDQKLRIHSEPGERFIYSGEGMTLLQVVIEKMTGKPLEQLMQEHVFGPYGMTHVELHVAAAVRGGLRRRPRAGWQGVPEGQRQRCPRAQHPRDDDRRLRAVHDGSAARRGTQRGVLERDLQAAGAHPLEDAVRAWGVGDDVRV